MTTAAVAGGTRLRDLDCPVCPRTGLAPGTSHCPNCTVDLRPLWNLRELPIRYQSEAAEAFRGGDLDRAWAKLLLALEVAEGDDPELCALLGEVCWRRGDRGRATSYWKQGLALDSAHEGCLRQLRRAALLRTGRRLAAGASALVLAAVLATGGWIARGRRELPISVSVSAAAPLVVDGGPAAAAPPAPAPPLLAVDAAVFARAEARREASQFHAVALRVDRRTQRAALLPPVSAGPEAAEREADAGLRRIAERLSSRPGVRADRAGRKLRITFAEGLFGASSEQLTAAGAEQLRSVAAILDAAELPLLVIVAGATDDQQPAPGGRWRTNEQLARARAEAAIASMLPALGSRGSAALRPAVLARAPFGNDTVEARARNRSVVLSVGLPVPLRPPATPSEPL